MLAVAVAVDLLQDQVQDKVVVVTVAPLIVQVIQVHLTLVVAVAEEIMIGLLADLAVQVL
jgi:hypothetical protein